MIGRMPARPRGAGPHQVARVVWLAMLASVAIYFVLLSVLTPTGSPGAAPEMIRLLRKAFVMVAAGQTFAIWVIRRRLLAPTLAVAPAGTPRELEPGRALGVHIVCWALAESIAIYGLVLGLIGRGSSLSTVFFAWGAGLLLLLRPRSELFG